MVNLSKFLMIFSTAVLLGSCGCLHHLPPAENNVSVRDSVVISYRDCVKVVPVEKVVDIVPAYDTLKLETSLARAEAYVDTLTHTLKGKIENRKGAEFKYIEKTVYKEHRDTTYIKEPFPVIQEKKVVPKWSWYLLVFVVIECLVFAAWIYLKKIR